MCVCAQPYPYPSASVTIFKVYSNLKYYTHTRICPQVIIVPGDSSESQHATFLAWYANPFIATHNSEWLPFGCSNIYIIWGETKETEDDESVL